MFKQALLVLGLSGVAGLAAATPALTASAQPEPLVVAAESGSRAYLHHFNLPAHGVAIQGYSPVSYFEGRAERGSAMFAVEHRGVTYHLTSAAQVATFQKNPARYEPAFGGWCATGMAVQDKFPIDPTSFKIVDDQIYLFLTNPGVDALEIWNGKDEAAMVRDAKAYWKKVQG